jgi:Zn-dependent peptidase ImmA (M78 family)/transcriptional regulator with XRE-family HTH domain
MTTTNRRPSMSTGGSQPGGFNPRRLRVARERRGLTKDALARLCDVSRRAVTDWEGGRVETPPVDRIAAALEFPRAFFGRDDADDLAADSVSFRALTAMSQRQVRKVLANAAMVMEFSAWLEDRYRTPAVDIPSIEELTVSQHESEPSPVDAAAALRAIWGLGAKPVRDMLVLLESRGVYVFGLAADDREVDAFSFWQAGRPYVFVNVAKSAERVRFDLAHELGHLCMHRGVPTCRNRRFELAANTFASAFLMPSDGLLPQLAGPPGLADVLRLKRHWRVSAVAMIRRLHQLGRLSDWQYRSWLIDFSRRGFRTSEPDGLPLEQSSLLRQVMSLAREDGWTLAKISSSLGIPASDLGSALFGLTIAPVLAGAGPGGAVGAAAVARPRLRSV